VEAKAARMLRDREFVGTYLASHPCLDCGEADTRVLDFDHVGEKTRDVCEMVLRGLPVEALAAEIERCQVVCANCHRRRTATRAGWRRLDLVRASFKNWKQRRNIEFVYGHLASNPCVDCGNADPLVLEFDHVADKRDSVMNLAWDGYSLASIVREIGCCEVRCCNCHRRRTVERRVTKKAV
jgi:L-lysine 2,3-aminomutase